MESTNHYLKYVRENTSYGALRFLLNLCTGLQLFGVWTLTLLAYIFYDVPSEMIGGAIFRMFVLVGAVVFTILIVASRQAVVLVIDISDTLLEANRRKGS